jgi:Protein of unknown function (DUF3365)
VAHAARSKRDGRQDRGHQEDSRHGENPGAAVGLIGAAPTECPEYQQARRISAQIVQDTLALLVKELGARGPAGAIEACSAVALDLATKHEQAGWRVRRVSRKVRDPADTPDAHEAAVLERFETLKATGGFVPDTQHAELVAAAGKTSLRYLRPIVIATPVCLTCRREARSSRAGRLEPCPGWLAPARLQPHGRPPSV